MKTLFLRVFIEINEPIKAKNLADSFISLLKNICMIKVCMIKKYWKIEEYFEITFNIELDDEFNRKFNDILHLLGDKWEIQNEFEAIWNYECGKKSGIDRTKWMHIELIK